MSGGTEQAAGQNDHGNGYEPFAKGPLSDAELLALRRIIRDEARSRHFWRQIRLFGAWGAGAIAGVAAVWDEIKWVFLKLTQGPP